MTPPGLLVEWMRERGISFEVQPSWTGTAAPDPADYAFVASLGSPYGPNDTHEVAVVEELKLIGAARSEEHTSELQSPCNLVCRLLLEKKNTHRSRRMWSAYL